MGSTAGRGRLGTLPPCGPRIHAAALLLVHNTGETAPVPFPCRAVMELECTGKNPGGGGPMTKHTSCRTSTGMGVREGLPEPSVELEA